MEGDAAQGYLFIFLRFLVAIGPQPTVFDPY